VEVVGSNPATPTESSAAMLSFFCLLPRMHVFFATDARMIFCFIVNYCACNLLINAAIFFGIVLVIANT